MNLRSRHLAAGVMACCMAAFAAGATAHAGIIQANAINGSETGFVASAGDLINSGAASLSSVTHSGYTPFAATGGGPTSAANLTDGGSGAAFIGSGNKALNTVAFDADGIWTSTYRLDTSVNGNGYDIGSIQTISGWATPRRNQRFELLMSTVSSPDSFTSYGTYSYLPGGAGAAMISLNGSSGPLARNVAAVRFNVQQAGNTQTVYREFDVFGSVSAAAPPPLRQVTPDDARIAYSDYARMVTLNAREARFDRIIAGATGDLQNANPAARVRFRTDATSITASFTTGSLGITQGTGVILIDGERAGIFQTTGANSTVSIDVPVDGVGYHDVDLLMPYSQDVRFTGLKVNDTALFQAVTARPTTRYVAYGDSITGGFWSSDASSGYPSLVAAERNWEVVNMGFGWRGLKDSGTGGVDGQTIATLGADVVSVMMGYNDASSRVSAASYRVFMEALVSKIRQADRSVPIYLISPLYTSNAVNQPWLLQYRDEIIDLVADSPDPQLHWIDGLALGIDAANVGSLTSDGIHPNDAGFAVVAANLAPRLVIPAPRMGMPALQPSLDSLQMMVTPEPGGLSLAAAAAVAVIIGLRRRPGTMP